MIALRKLFGVFGRGGIEFLESSNRKVLVYLRTYQDEQVLCIANLSRFAQPLDLDLSKLEGMVPVEMLGYVEFPAIGREPYRLTMSPYGFLWLELQRKTEPAKVSADLAEDAPLNVAAGWDAICEGVGRQRLENLSLPAYLPQQRWFAAKARRIKSTRISNWAALRGVQAALAVIEVQFDSGEPAIYLLPLGMSFGDAAIELRRNAPKSIIAPIFSGKETGLLHDGLFDDKVCLELLALIENSRELRGRRGDVQGARGKAYQEILGDAETPLAVRRVLAEQSNSSIIFGDRFILKMFRRLERGVNPDVEIGRYLTEKTGFDRVPPFAGSIELKGSADSGASTLAMLQGFSANEGDGWTWTVEELERYFEARAPQQFPENGEIDSGSAVELSEQPLSQMALDNLGIYFDAATTLGKRTAELHLALAAATDDPAFTPEKFTRENLEATLVEFRAHASQVLDALKEKVPNLPDEVVEISASVLSRRRRILNQLSTPDSVGLHTLRMRIHGDYHLGQVLRVKTDFLILDFEGEPTRSLEYRRAKQCPLKDVAGMLRSFSYAAYATLINYTTRHPEDVDKLEPWAQLWERSASAAFLRAYRETAVGAAFLPASSADFQKLLDVFLLDKALYEVLYELNARPAWVRIPLLGIMSLAL